MKTLAPPALRNLDDLMSHTQMDARCSLRVESTKLLDHRAERFVSSMHALLRSSSAKKALAHVNDE
jgi:hypothetical protein